jgi:hypothetical protein
MMKEYEFTLTFSLQNSNEAPEKYEEALEKNNCTDALLGIGRKGMIALDFGRSADSAEEAISSAISAVKKSIPGAILIESEPDFVSITDIAEFVNRSRQNIRKLMLTNESDCPPPIHSGHPSLWHLYDILQWLQQSKGYGISEEVIEVAKITKFLNAFRSWHQLESSQKKQAENMVNASLTETFIPSSNSTVFASALSSSQREASA